MATGLITVSGSGVSAPNLGNGAGIVPGSPTGVNSNYLFANLPSAASSASGTIEYTTDQGLVYSNGVSWVVIGSGVGGGAPTFANSVSAAISSSQNNYSPAGYVAGTTNRLLLTPSAAVNLSGLVASPTDGYAVVIYNVSATNSITFLNQSGLSSAANQFLCPGVGSAVLGPQAAALLIYVVSLSAWIFG